MKNQNTLQSLNAPIIIIGAPRSGTNMLRDALTKISGLGTWPCDEINYIWRHGNLYIEHDEFTEQMATSRVKKYIRSKFVAIARQHKMDRIVEKTCANALRVAFVKQVIPEAHFVYIFRDGRDAALSASKRWKASFDWKYIYAKAKYVPYADLPFYAVKYLWNRIYRLFNKEARLAFWGPKFVGFQQAIANETLINLCATQWKKCIENTEKDLTGIAEEHIHKIKYEDFVSNPQLHLAQLLNELNVAYTQTEIEKATKGIFKESVGKWRKELNEQQIQTLNNIVEKPLGRLGYEL